MKLTYRGVSYDYTPNPTPRKAASMATGVYRGHAIEFQPLAEIPAQPVADLTWRGVPYRTGTVAEASATPTPTAATPANVAPQGLPKSASSNGAVVVMARNLFIRHHQRSRRREQGMMIRLAAEVGIPVEVAAHYESHVQGKLPHDFAGYDRSSSAMS
jgi:hypothetical protein